MSHGKLFRWRPYFSSNIWKYWKFFPKTTKIFNKINFTDTYSKGEKDMETWYNSFNTDAAEVENTENKGET